MKLSDLVQETKGPRGKLIGMTIPISVGVVPIFMGENAPKIMVQAGSHGNEIAKVEAGKAESLRELAVTLARTKFGLTITPNDLDLGWSGTMSKAESQYGFYVYYVLLDKEIPGKMVNAFDFIKTGRQSQRSIITRVLEKVKKH